ncbi:hypothetical protein SPSIL_058040 [Sporomusa silvacetica DSM 10669]|uniref:MPN domain-containing protein n=1 Tax=Sporomusa silvacetica DSM 10669 TaxID=1123289 RepID=A0ABZ3IVI3_9FIRM|nr:DNA repair protein RadC [Sporomusa silvacetica]OZC14248.1 hypothetical protein SPSIL_49750 [Sporomusa silvacetica DSM 10669]
MSNHNMKNAISEGLGIACTKSYLVDLPNEELLQIIMPREAASQLLAEYSNVYEVVMNTTINELANIKGMGKTKIYKIECLREIVRRFQTESSSRVTLVRSPKDVFDYMTDMQYLNQEQFRIVMVNTKNKILGQRIISQGTLNMTPVSPREIFNSAIKNMVASIILVHNHPSGDSHPSQEDINITDMVVKAGKIIGISVLDHIIIGKNEYCSFKEKGLIQ